MMPTNTAAPAAALARDLIGRLEADGADPGHGVGHAELTVAVGGLLDAGAIALPLELGNVGQFGQVNLTAHTAAVLAAANLLEARNAAGSASCEEPTEHVRDLCMIADGWRQLAVALATHPGAMRAPDNEDDR